MTQLLSWYETVPGGKLASAGLPTTRDTGILVSQAGAGIIQGGITAAAFTIISPDSAKKLGAALAGSNEAITVHFVLRGKTLDGWQLDSNEFAYSINVCQGCLVNPFCCSITNAKKNNDCGCVETCIPGSDLPLSCPITGALKLTDGGDNPLCSP